MLNFNEVHELIRELGEEVERIEADYFLGYKLWVLDVAERYGIMADAEDLDDPDLIRELILNADGSKVDDDILAERLRGVYYTKAEWDDMREEWDDESLSAEEEQNNTEGVKGVAGEDNIPDILNHLWERGS